jgi:putative peptidoglycan lipid II flippase
MTPAHGRRPPSTGQATAILAAGTFASRVTGFLRVLTIGYVLGVTSLSDAYNYANGIPNIMYDLLLGGILSATLVPVFVEQLRGDDQTENMRAISAVVSAIAVALAGVTALLWLLAPWIIHFYLLLNPASTGSAERALATQLLHYFAPQVFFLGAIVVSTALLNARRNFTAAAFSPVVNNLIAIGSLLAAKAVASQILTTKTTDPAGVLSRMAHDEHAIWVLGIGTTAGYVVQLLVQLPAMRRVGFRLRPVWDLHHPIVKKVAHLSVWLIGVVIANQVSLALVMILAGKVQGGVTAYQFSYQFFQLPYALIAVSIATALMPDLAERWTSGDRRGFERQFVAGLRITLAVIVPVGVIYVAVAQPFIQLAVHHGRVTQSGAHLVSTTLALFAIGLPGFSAYFLLMRMYQAMQKVRAMFWIYALENGLTVIAAVVLDHILGVPGLALAWVAPYTVASLVAAYDLRKRVGTLGGMHTVRAVVRILVASGVTAAAVVGVGLAFPRSDTDVVLIGRVLAQVGVGTIVYVWLGRALGIKELRPLARLARRLVGVT